MAVVGAAAAAEVEVEVVGGDEEVERRGRREDG